jgi:hypothetical protein
MFLGQNGERTMFMIASQTVRDISRYSGHPEEKELLLLPGTVLIVEGILPQNNLTLIQMKEKIDPRLFLLPASTPTTTTTPTIIPTPTPIPKPIPTPTKVQENSKGNVPPKVDTVTVLPPEIIKIILSFLPVPMICRMRLVCKAWLRVVDDNDLWKKLTERDYYDFIKSKPAENSPDSLVYLSSILGTPASAQFKHFLHVDQNLTKPINLKEQYILYHKVPKLSGIWLAIYSGHGLEVLEFIQHGYDLTVIKLKGDDNVPSGQIAFTGTIKQDGTAAIGKFRLADSGFRNPRWGFGLFTFQKSIHSVWIEKMFYSKKLFWRSPYQNLTQKNITTNILKELEKTCPVSKSEASQFKEY